ncbi:carboxypeptidase regulatory-like domain-containing protein [Chitinophagaceae bacterium LB-8]|uniref:Carboxypeptidase regulatory-like domain-containing protein n=1 Tax=Paraflavisolibacter caeni TaxID=2982496 RepID=A0A9X3B897_9BACT|nr:carboxypeptidase regulatory-like domain-containing protein [Paraflavisolibacter caeni]MCU7550370.1 carboxypeptidase regulatory-like domain-containing protein [Paraflavisolibacter caeni]
MRKIIYLLIITLFSHALNAQVTTGSISGSVKSAKDEPLVGATITVKHEPTGSIFTTTSRSGGRFDIQNIPPGGPYTVTTSFVGFENFKRSEIQVPLGERFDLQISMGTSAQQLSEVTVTTTRSGNTEKTGATTNISRRQIQNMPNISRSLTNITRATPQANGNSFAGMNNRFNNITIDGSLFNNNFGRGGDGMVPGGATSAISIDAIDQMQINISPYDVRQSGFVGGGINAVTRRGTNNWYGTAYGYYRNQDFNGDKVKGIEVVNAKRSTKIYGGSVGGPIIKDKLFFFVNGEFEKRTNPGQTWLAKRPGENDNNPQVTPVLASDLDKLRTYLINTYNYDPGAYEGYDFETDNKKFLGRLDWNITNKHRLTFRYTQSETNDDDQVNASSVTGVTANRINNSRRGGSTGGLVYTGTNFKNNTVVKSGVLEFNSNFNSLFSNQVIASYTDNQLQRIPNSNMPFVDIMRDPNNVYISLGTDLFSYKNSISDQAWNIADNLTINLQKHTLTAGASFEYLSFANSFSSAGGPSYYRYNTLQDFLDNKAPAVFAVTYAPSDRTTIVPAEAKFAQLGVFLQDFWNVSPKLKVTYGLRVDKPFYPYDAPRNQALEPVVFRNEDWRPEVFDVSQWPNAKILASPRVGFTYDIKDNKSIVARGGSGIFTGRIPFIWLVNQVGDNGVIRALYQANATELNNIRYNADRTTYIPNPVPAVGTTIPSGSSFSAADQNFEMPQVWRSNLAVDKKFAKDFTFTFESIFTKMLNNVYFRNANLGAQTGTLGGVADKRPVYATKLNSNINQMIAMDNVQKGYSASFTAMVQKAFSKGWEGNVAYTYTIAKDVAIGSSDQSGSGWSTNNIIMNPNKPELGYSNYSIPHRVVANLSYRIDYWQDKTATTIGLFYSGSAQERYSFRYGADINGDGATNDILYIPKNASEIQFVEGFKVGNNVYTTQQQSDAFFAFIDNDKYLKEHKGEYMDRYGAKLPWWHSLDMRVMQDFNVKAGNKKHSFQVSADVTNVLNLLNNDWGYRYSYTFGTFQDMGILGVPTSGSTSNNSAKEAFNAANPKFTFDPNGPKKGYQPNYSTSSTWGIQLGLRYIFQ